jgi:translation elongation factor EF-Tu-like GTPase
MPELTDYDKAIQDIAQEINPMIPEPERNAVATFIILFEEIARVLKGRNWEFSIANDLAVKITNSIVQGYLNSIQQPPMVIDMEMMQKTLSGIPGFPKGF